MGESYQIGLGRVTERLERARERGLEGAESREEGEIEQFSPNGDIFEGYSTIITTSIEGMVKNGEEKTRVVLRLYKSPEKKERIEDGPFLPDKFKGETYEELSDRLKQLGGNPFMGELRALREGYRFFFDSVEDFIDNKEDVKEAVMNFFLRDRFHRLKRESKYNFDHQFEKGKLNKEDFETYSKLMHRLAKEDKLGEIANIRYAEVKRDEEGLLKIRPADGKGKLPMENIRHEEGKISLRN